MKLSCVVIWYNPDDSCVQNIKTYHDLLDRVYVVDNSDKDNSSLLTGIDNIDYTPNLSNLGIAKAQNIGCRKALEEGYKWCMTMDQDSFWDKEQLKEYIDRVEECIRSEKVYSFGICTAGDPVLPYTHKFKQFIKKVIHYKSKVIIHPDREYIDIVIASGNIISLDKWNELDGFNEELFIDEVDNEFCLRLNDMYPKSILMFNDIKMNHHLGEPKRTLFFRLDFHSGVRLYYCVRNVMYVTQRYPDYDKKYRRRESYRRVFFQNIRDLRFKDVSWMIKGYIAYKKGITGKYHK